MDCLVSWNQKKEKEMSEYPVGEQIFLSMLATAESLGHPLPWANAAEVYPGGRIELSCVTADLIDKGQIEATSRGFVRSLLCEEHSGGKTTN